jgi:hypothetical protein
MLLALALLAGEFRARAQEAATAGQAPRGVVLARGDAAAIPGRVVGDAAAGFRFQPDGGQPPQPLGAPWVLRFAGSPRVDAVDSGFHVLAGVADRLSGVPVELDADGLGLASRAVGRAHIGRGGFRAIVQRPGQILVLEESFDRLDPARWSRAGQPAIRDTGMPDNAHDARLPADGSSLSTSLAEPIAAGLVTLRVRDEDVAAPGHRWSIALDFQAAGGIRSIDVQGEWQPDEALKVRSSDTGPTLAVQPLARRPGTWRQLAVRFGNEQTRIEVDGNELAFGDGPGGPLTRIRIEARKPQQQPPPREPAPALELDDLQVHRFTEPPGTRQRDPDQDEAQLASGDQIFGLLRGLDRAGVVLGIDGRESRLPWSEVAGVYPRRAPRASAWLEGLWVRAHWHGGPPGPDRPLDQAEGVLRSWDATHVAIETPYLGTLRVPTDRLDRVEVLGARRRQVLDVFPRHLGNAWVRRLDPPAPEGGRHELGFDLDPVPSAPLTLVLDVVDVIGMAGDLQFSDRVKQGELVTHVALNGQRFDTLNRHVTTRNDQPLSIRLALPAASLRKGRNVVAFEQVGTRDEPGQLDNLGLLGVALEAGPPTAPAPRSPAP